MKSLSKTVAAKGPKLPYGSGALHRDVMRVQSAYKKYQRSHRRTAVYRFLTAVFETMTIWDADGRAASRAHRAMVEERCKAPRSLEPFAALLAAAAHPRVVDERTLAKWSRVLRFAAAYKLPSTRLSRFVKKKGGINACAALFTRRIGSGRNRS